MKTTPWPVMRARKLDSAFWVYEHWAAESKAVVHRSTWGSCRDGHGCHDTKRGEQNGRWRGFALESEARAYAKNTGRPVRIHRCI